MSRTVAFVALTLLCAGAAAAPTPVYRCGVDGRSYSQESCEQGRALDVADPRTAQQAAQARQAVLRDARQGDALERSRLRAEEVAARQGPTLIGWSSRSARTDDARCATGGRCQPAETQRRADKAHTVKLYRGAAKTP